MDSGSLHRPKGGYDELIAKLTQPVLLGRWLEGRRHLAVVQERSRDALRRSTRFIDPADRRGYKMRVAVGASSRRASRLEELPASDAYRSW